MVCCINEIVIWFNNPFFSIVGGISTMIAILGFFYGIYIIFKGVIPVWIRLGRSLSNRKIAVYAEQDFENLKDLLIDSGLFRTENVKQIHSNSIAKGKDYTMMLVNYPDYKENIEYILQNKNDSDALIIYAPNSAGMINDALLHKINDCRYSLIVNFRGRLMNDIFTSMITTKYEKR